MFDRLKILIDMDKLKNKTVMVIGLGGVGGHAFESLVRSGIENIAIIDNDIIEITNLNRQVLAYQNTVGKYKVDVAKALALNINPNINIKTYKLFLDESNIDEVFSNKIDFVIDAVDTINAKKSIIKKCLKENIQLISIMGTGNKMHPEQLEITNIRNTSYDPIAKNLRKMVKEEKIVQKIPVIFSKEKPLINKKVGSNAFVPATAGLIATSYVINKFLEEEHE